MRLFVGVPIDEETSSVLGQWVSRLGLPGRLVPPENWHITLRFIGDTDEVGFDRLLAALDQAHLPSAFDIVLGEVAGFPRAAKATVGFLEITTPDRVGDLALEVERAVDRAGFGREERPFHPHLTLTRNRPPDDLRPFAGSPVGLTMRVSEVVVFRSHLDSDGARYEPLERLPLR